MKQYILIAVIFAAAITLHFVNESRNQTPEPENPNAPFSEDCVFYRKVVGGDMVISEPTSGRYNYEVYATSEGIEVWKCNKF